MDRLLYSRLHNNVSNKHYEKRETKEKEKNLTVTSNTSSLIFMNLAESTN
ncbi:hypothetical protein [Candidatus Nitrosocosmicus sp. FF01]